MLRRALASTRYIVIVPVVCTFLASLGLLLFEAVVLISALYEVTTVREFNPKTAKALAVGLIEAVDVFLIAIVAYITSMGLYSLFVDNGLPLPRWLQVNDLDDVKKQLVSAVIAVLGVLFLREAVASNSSEDLLRFGAALAVVIVSLTYYLSKLKAKGED